MLNIANRTRISLKDPLLGEALKSIEDAVNQGFRTAGIDPTTAFAAPPAIQGLVVNAANGSFTGTITDNSAVHRAINYFVEWSTDKNFQNPLPRTIHLGASRDFDGLSLGNIMVYFRAYSMYLGSDAPSSIVYSSTNPVIGGGSAAPTYPVAGGSGTAAANGQQAGTGFGPTLYRTPQTLAGKSPTGQIIKK